VTKKPTKGGGGAAAARKSGKAAKDPNKPKRPASAFFVFMYFSYSIFFLLCDHCSQMENKLCFFLNEIFIIDCREEFREQYKREHPKNKSVAAVSIQLLLV
jgi:hypothetical protein